MFLTIATLSLPLIYPTLLYSFLVSLYLSHASRSINSVTFSANKITISRFFMDKLLVTQLIRNLRSQKKYFVKYQGCEVVGVWRSSQGSRPGRQSQRGPRERNVCHRVRQWGDLDVRDSALWGPTETPQICQVM